MKKRTKALLIPIAAFAVTVTAANAFNSDVLQSAGLEAEQISAFERARELHKDGDRDAARDVLLNAGVDMHTIQSVKEAMQEHRMQRHNAIDEALNEGNYDAFLEAVKDSPMADIVDTPEEFDLFVQAHELRESGDMQGAYTIMEDLGLEGKMMKEKGHGMHKEKKEKHGMEKMMKHHIEKEHTAKKERRHEKRMMMDGDE